MLGPRAKNFLVATAFDPEELAALDTRALVCQLRGAGRRDAH